MKKIMILALAFISLNAFAQGKRGEDNQRHDRKEMRMQGADFTPEQQATLLTKKMTLNLDLTESQQKEVYNLNLSQAKERQANREAFKKAKESGKKPTEQERYDNMIARLDSQILMKSKMKSILKSEQYAMWEKSMADHSRERKGFDDKRGDKRPDRDRRS
ncbi:hypothetical protein FNB79_01620 [Formosa sediminum]|uniref:DUF4890 domain-containing protein n=1 Tax=Formosa sediminum TaxID=2594004 RepID=A0A516GMM6_9FLAO|nr:hypothetical protein [Formosa sediminum]QDO92725.1 hypothetical protein FNB79_01620 [Formosa sediminum]